MIRFCPRLIFCLLLGAGQAHAAADADVANTATADMLRSRASELKLAAQPGWRALLHYGREALSARVQSQADDPAFFLAANGNTDAAAELSADLDAMLQTQHTGHAQCVFPARWHWLKQQLDIHPGDYDVACPRLQHWLDNMPSDTVSLVFPAMYLNNPGSAFGHTFLRFDNAHSPLLSYALNYAAAYDPDDNAALYAYNGLFGGYRGVFNLRQYFEMVQDYSNIENRDIWEYRLALSADEVAQLKRHVWEVIDIDFDYFFFRENCSYRLLALIESVKPHTPLTSIQTFPLYAIPVDTVRTLHAAGLIQQRNYRPALASQLQQAFATHDSAQQQRVLALLKTDRDIAEVLVNATANESAAALDSAYLITQFNGEAHSARAQAVLSARSRISLSDTAQVSPDDNASAPETGHASAVLGISAGRMQATTQQSQSTFDVFVKPAFHDLLDAPQGYASGAQIGVLNTRLRWLPQQQTLQLQRLDFFNIVSLSPWQAWYQPPSWQFDIKLQRQFITPQTSDLVFNTRIGGGLAAQSRGATWFSMLNLDGEATDNYAKGYSALAGLQLGMYTHFTGGQLLLSAERNHAFSGFDFNRNRYSAGVQFNLKSQTALRVNYEKTVFDNFKVSDWQTSLHWYF